MMPFRSMPLPRWLEAGDLIRVEEYREDGTLVVRADLPGIDPDKDAELTVSDGCCTSCRGPARAYSALTDQMNLVRLWAAVGLLAAGARIAVHRPERVRLGTAYVVVSNHQSNLDPMVHVPLRPHSPRHSQVA